MPARSVHPLTRAEATTYLESSRHADVMLFVAELAACGDRCLTVTNFGVSLEGRDMPLLILSAQGLLTPEESQRAGIPIVLNINGIHAGEVEGKEVSLMLARDLLDGLEGLFLIHVRSLSARGA